MTYGRIYVVTNTTNGKQYVGQTTATLKRRWRGHCWDATSGRRKGALHQAIHKYGRESFTIEEVSTAEDKTGLDAQELAWVRKLNTMSPNGYNLTEGGGSAGRPSKETVERRRQALMGHATSQATRDKIRAAQVGRKLTPEHREKLRQAKVGRSPDPEMVARRNASIRAAYEQRRDDIVAKITRVHVGRKHTEETKAKMRAAAQRRKAR